jgi:hypothetical protein
MEQQIRNIIDSVFYDLSAAYLALDDSIDAERLADFVGDRMYDDCPEYRTLPHEQRRATVLKVCKEYV